MSDSAVLIWFGCVCNESGGVIGAGSVCIQLYIQVSVPTRLFLLHLNHSSHLNIPKMYYGCLHTPPVTWSAYNRTGFSLILRKLKRKRRFIDCGLEVMMDLTDEQDIRYFLEADVLASATKQIRWNGGMLQKRWSSELRALGGFKNVVWFKARGQEAHGVRLRRRGDPRHLSPRGALIISKVPVLTRSCLNCALVMSSNNSKVAIMWHSHYAQLQLLQSAV